MANAAAKKAAAAKAATATIYQPVLLGTNAIYILLLIFLDVSFSMANIGGILVTWGLQAFAYVGILDQAANANTTSSSKAALVGGAHLDLLALTVIVQYGTVLHSSKWYGLLISVPVFGAWSLYQTFRGGSNSRTASNLSNSSTAEDTPSELSERRQKRAEKRRQKWS